MSRRSRRNRQANRVARPRRLEALESRVVMSASPLSGPLLTTHGALDDAPALTTHGAPMLGGAIVESGPAHDPDADFWLADGTVFDTDGFDQRIETTLREAHGLTGQDEVIDTYGFDGSGQTVVVIDSGIAWSHTALGGGLGAGHRVVGGWDFTENDADPYDDGPGGSSNAHGTHVAGIIGADGDGVHSGVATGVDLVGLRVFDDAGNGYFSWVEQALDWVYTNRNAFENDITAVNLSLGTSWNSDSVPSWAMLEDEFAALEAEGIFISVSAGNDFTTYNEPGVSYPAASDHVIPVMSVNTSGALSYFSQRATYAIGAPGRWITSTVPDYAANDGDTIDDDWLSMSGTSMAAPYVAGASVLIRQAMEFVGQTGIDQWDIYNHMMSTADSFFDSATNETYKRLNLQAAIDALMPSDDYGETVATAHNLGTLQDTPSSGPFAQSTSVSGVISTLTDADHFTFTAGATGTVTISAANVTHDLVASWEAWGGEWTVTENGDCVLDVVAGQTYRVGLSSAGGLGYYSLTASLEETFSPIQSGAVGPQETRTGLSVSGESWYAFTAGAAGYFTVESLPQQGAATVAIYDANQSLLAAAGSRADATVTQGQVVLVRVEGDASNLDLRLTNAVNQVGNAVTLTGTSGDDAIEFLAGADTHAVSLNGVEYQFAAGGVSSVDADGAGGSDSASLVGTDASEQVVLQAGLARMTWDGGSVTVTGASDVLVDAGGGTDAAYLYDTSGDDWLTSLEGDVTLGGDGYRNRVVGAEQSLAYATTGNDVATIFDGAGDDEFSALSDYVVMQSGGDYRFASAFDSVYAYSTGGNDRAFLYDSRGDDTFVSTDAGSLMRDAGGGFYNYAAGFRSVFAIAWAGGEDTATLIDSAGDDEVTAGSGYAVMDRVDTRAQANGFERVQADSTSGADTAYLFDGVGDDVLTTTDSFAELAAIDGGQSTRATGFDHLWAFATSGNDLAVMYDSAGDDVFVASPAAATMRRADQSVSRTAVGFDRVTAYSSAGQDDAYLSDSAGDDSFYASLEHASLSGAGFANTVFGFGGVFAYASTGNDTATLQDSVGDDLFVATASYGMLVGNAGAGDLRLAEGFDTTTAVSNAGGSDIAALYDTDASDSLSGWGDAVQLSSGGATKLGVGFSTVRAYGGGGGADSSSLSAIDYAFEQIGAWG